MKISRSFLCRRLTCVLVCCVSALLLLLLLPASLLAQQSNTPQATPPQESVAAPTTPAELEKFLQQAARRTEEYIAVFKNLLAEETKTIETYDEDGRAKRRRRIVSDFVVYQSRLHDASVSEYRNVREVDGRTVTERDKRVLKLFERLAKAKSLDKELERIDREGNRYDLTDRYTGLTLNQGLLLSDEIRPALRFEVAGREQLDGHEVVIVRYQQVRQTPSVKFDFTLPDKLKDAEFLYRGRLWLDAGTAQLWREEREVTMRPSFLKDPLVIVSFDFRYAASRFGILLPRRLVFSSFAHGRGRATGTLSLSLSTRMTFEYGAFSRFDVTVPEAVITPPAAK